jgi:hypothetical protein
MEQSQYAPTEAIHKLPGGSVSYRRVELSMNLERVTGARELQAMVRIGTI